MREFTLDTYKNLLEVLKQIKYSPQSPLDSARVLTTFLPFKEYIQSHHGGQAYNLSRRIPIYREKTDQPIIILRHTADRRPPNALKMANLKINLV